MNAVSPLTKAARHARIAGILHRTSVRSQEELATLLAQHGVHVAQATLSRDLEELGAVRLRGPNGALVYALPEEPGGPGSRPGAPAGGIPAAPGYQAVMAAAAASRSVGGQGTRASQDQSGSGALAGTGAQRDGGGQRDSGGQPGSGGQRGTGGQRGSGGQMRPGAGQPAGVSQSASGGSATARGSGPGSPGGAQGRAGTAAVVREINPASAGGGGGSAVAVPGHRAAASAVTALGSLPRMASELLVSAEASANLVVLRTPAGGAQLLASAIDHAGWDTILGTVAGDDTVLVISRDPAGGDGVAAALLRLAERRDS